MKKITKKVDANKLLVEKLVELWYETQMGHYKKCQEKQFEFADIMWELYEEFHPEENDESSYQWIF